MNNQRKHKKIYKKKDAKAQHSINTAIKITEYKKVKLSNNGKNETVFFNKNFILTLLQKKKKKKKKKKNNT